MELGDRRIWKLKDAALAINGDDVALRANKETYTYWSKITNFGGLIESVGKTFVSRDWVSINSMMYERCDPFPLEDKRADGSKVIRLATLREVPHVNMGLVMGQKRGGGTFTAKDIDGGVTFATRARELIDHCPKFLRTLVYDDFIEQNREQLKATRLPWFIPEWLGGLGLPIVDPEKHFNSEMDLRIATRVLMNWNQKGQRPVCLNSKATPWKVRQLCSTKLPISDVTMNDDSSVEALDRVNGLLAVDLLFNSDFTLDDLYNEEGKLVNIMGAVNHNARLWTPVGPRDPLTGVRDSRRYPVMPESVLFGPRRYSGLRVKDRAFGTKRFPSPGTRPTSTKELLQLPKDYYLD
jgi:hypothetical protein